MPQFKFGAREAAAPVILGLMKVSLGLLLGSSLLQLLSSFPNPMLGALLALAGIELACSARAQVGARGWVPGLSSANSAGLSQADNEVGASASLVC